MTDYSRVSKQQVIDCYETSIADLKSLQRSYNEQRNLNLETVSKYKESQEEINKLKKALDKSKRDADNTNSELYFEKRKWEDAYHSMEIRNQNHCNLVKECNEEITKLKNKFRAVREVINTLMDDV